MALTEQQLISWSKPLSTTEDEKCKRAVAQVTEAIRRKFNSSSVSIFLQGSYQNDTNVRLDSDVDIVARYNDVFYHDLYFLTEEQKQIYNANRTPGTYSFDQFKTDIKQVLENEFGSAAQLKNKCIFVQGNTYRVNADVVPCFTLKRFRTATEVSAEGIRFYSDDNKEIESFPEQHYRNGVSKNTSTGRMYKRTVRILKRVRNELIESGTISEKLVSSFFIECLVYNVPNGHFSSGYRDTLKSVIAKVYNDMLDPAVGDEYEEVSGLRWLFKGSSRSKNDARIFMDKCWDYAGFN